MLGRILLKSALFAAPLALAGTATAQSGYYANTAPADYGTAPAAILLFSGEDFRGDSREIFEPVGRLGDIRFNDRTRSIAVLEGAWEACEHANFTGRCVFLRQDEPDLGYFGLNGKITAVRPIYEYTDAEHGLMFTRDKSGYIRYADQNRYGYDDYRYGYGTTRHIDVWHYGYTPAYRQYGYYNPTLGYGPYGFAYNIGRPARYRNYRHRDRDHRRRDPRLGRTDGRVVLYEHSNLRGQTFAINGTVRDLGQTGFNDRTSSLEIRSGVWEVCQHSNFRGNCQIIDATGGVRMNDAISSIREVTNRQPQPYMSRDGDRRRGAVRDDRGRTDRVDRRDGVRRSGQVNPTRDRLLGAADPATREPRTPTARDRRAERDHRTVRDRVNRRQVMDNPNVGSPVMSGDVQRRRPEQGTVGRVSTPVATPRRALPNTPAMRGQTARPAIAAPAPPPRPAPTPRASRPDPRSPAGIRARGRNPAERLQ